MPRGCCVRTDHAREGAGAKVSSGLRLTSAVALLVQRVAREPT